MSAESLRARLQAKLKPTASKVVQIDESPEEIRRKANIAAIDSGVSLRINKALQEADSDPVVYQHAIDNVSATETVAWYAILRESPPQVLTNAINKFIKISAITKRSIVFNAVANKNISDADIEILFTAVKTKNEAELLLAKIPATLSLDRAFLLAKMFIASNTGVEFTVENHAVVTLALAFLLLYFIPKQIFVDDYEIGFVTHRAVAWAENKSGQEVFRFATFLAACKMNEDFNSSKSRELMGLPQVRLR